MGLRLDRMVFDLYVGFLSAKIARKMIKAGNVSVNGRRIVQPWYELTDGYSHIRVYRNTYRVRVTDGKISRTTRLR